MDWVGHLGPLSAETTSQGEILGLAVGHSVSHMTLRKGRQESYMVTRLAWMAAKLVSSNKETR